MPLLPEDIGLKVSTTSIFHTGFFKCDFSHLPNSWLLAPAHVSRKLSPQMISCSYILLAVSTWSYPPARQKLKLPSPCNTQSRMDVHHPHVFPPPFSPSPDLQASRNSHLSSSIHSLTHCTVASALTVLADCLDSTKQLNFQTLFSAPSKYFGNVSPCLHPYSQCPKLQSSCLLTRALCLIFLGLLSFPFLGPQSYCYQN